MAHISPTSNCSLPDQGNPGNCLLEVRGLSKSFPGVKALDDVSLHLRAGEVLAVIGENGAGKSSLMKILAGVQTADTGQILLHGAEVRFESTRAALDAGVVLIHRATLDPIPECRRLADLSADFGQQIERGPAADG